jgi:hypothetical protein
MYVLATAFSTPATSKNVTKNSLYMLEVHCSCIKASFSWVLGWLGALSAILTVASGPFNNKLRRANSAAGLGKIVQMGGDQKQPFALSFLLFAWSLPVLLLLLPCVLSCLLSSLVRAWCIGA